MTRLEIELREALEELVESATHFVTPLTRALSIDLARALEVIAEARRQHGMSGKGHGVGSTMRRQALGS